ncbi:MAG: gluconolactonase [Actinomycetota bacterium]|nr:gluconolactonase [Glaciihabitans sp.]MDQ1562438.1 gluconolactonase [Actinomycetota bacterium]
MNTLLGEGAILEKLYTGSIWAEGPVWLPSSRSVRWSDIPNNRILEFSADTGETHVHREDVEFTNGRILDLDGTVLQCSHGRRSVEREVDGIPHTLVDTYDGVRLNSPNDIVVASDGAIWFTDPPYGIIQAREGHPGEMEYGGCYVFRLTTDGVLSPVITDRGHPNGLAFSPDESILYVSDTATGDGNIHAYDADVATGTATNGRLFAEPRPGVSDGFRVDVAGRVWTSAADAVHVYSPAGEELLTIPVPEVIANVCFGGDDGQDLYIAASTSLYRIRTSTTQAPRPV